MMSDTHINLNDTFDTSISENLNCGDNTQVLNVVGVKQFCRICASELDVDNLVNIFDDKGTEVDLQKQIDTHLRIKVTREDELPLQVCRTCICQLNICHSLFEISQKADYKLRQLFINPKMEQESESNGNCTMEVMSDMEASDHEQLRVQTNQAQPIEDKSSNPNPLLCDICGKCFKLVSNFQAHKRTHLDDSIKKKHHCPLCPKSFRSRFHLSEHTNVHNGTTPYGCPDCGKKFHKQSQLRQHSQTHDIGSRRAVCEVCGMSFNRRNNLRAHAKTHVEGRTFDCKLCQKQFPIFTEMLSHRKQHSQEDIKNRISLGLLTDKDQFYTCEVCGKILTNRDSLVIHVAQHKQRHNLKCPDCGKELRSQRSLLYHQRSQHTGERHFRCSFCPEGFMTRKLKEAHERRHTGEKPFTCEICSNAFRSRNNLMQHMLKHNGTRNFECTVCGKAFFRKGALTVHNRKHTGEKPFICDLCGRPFSQKNDMLKHQKTHMKLKTRKYSCDLCLAVFDTEVKLQTHKDENHNDNSDLIPLIITNNLFETLIITEDGQKIVVTTEGVVGDALLTASNSVV